VVVLSFQEEKTAMRDEKQQTEKHPAIKIVGNALDETELPPSLDSERINQLNKVVGLAAALLRPNPGTLTVAKGEQQAIPVVKSLGASEFFRTHPSLRFSLDMVAPNKGAIDADDFAFLPEAEGEIACHRLTPFLVTLYPLVVFANPLVYKLVKVKQPPEGRQWDIWNQSRALVLEDAVGRWISIRPSDGGGYQSFPPDHPGKYPVDAEWPNWDADEWLRRSVERGGLLIKDGGHHVFQIARWPLAGVPSGLSISSFATTQTAAPTQSAWLPVTS
jgi:hypothetical protein